MYHLLLFVIKLRPLSTNQSTHFTCFKLAKVVLGLKRQPTETSIWVFSLDPLTPVLGKEHIWGESTFGWVCVFLGFARWLSLLEKC